MSQKEVWLMNTERDIYNGCIQQVTGDFIIILIV